MEARAKDMELANLRLQLEQEKGKNKRGSEHNDGGGPGPRRKSAAPSEAQPTSSPQVVLMPYDDPMTQADLRSHDLGRKYCWVMVYSAPRALEVLDFKEEMSRVVTTALSDGKWMSLIAFKKKVRFSPAQPFVTDLHTRGLITGPVFFESRCDATHRFLVDAVQTDEIRRALLDSPSLMIEDGATYYKMHLVAE